MRIIFSPSAFSAFSLPIPPRELKRAFFIYIPSTQTEHNAISLYTLLAYTMAAIHQPPQLAAPVSASHTPWTSSATLAAQSQAYTTEKSKLRSSTSSAGSNEPAPHPTYIPATDDTSSPINRIGSKAPNPQIERVLTQGGPKKEKDVMNALLHQATRGEAPYPGKGTQEEPFIVDW
jgi:hypothetical protein